MPRRTAETGTMIDRIGRTIVAARQRRFRGRQGPPSATGQCSLEAADPSQRGHSRCAFTKLSELDCSPPSDRLETDEAHSRRIDPITTPQSTGTRALASPGNRVPPIQQVEGNRESSLVLALTVRSTSRRSHCLPTSVGQSSEVPAKAKRLIRSEVFPSATSKVTAAGH